MKPESTPEYFQFCDWETPVQTRDKMISLILSKDLTSKELNKLKGLELQETDRRKKFPELFVKCPVCYGYHGQLGNIDNLCEKHEAQFAPFRYDTEKFGREAALKLYKQMR